MGGAPQPLGADWRTLPGGGCPHKDDAPGLVDWAPPGGGADDIPNDPSGWPTGAPTSVGSVGWSHIFLHRSIYLSIMYY